MNKNKFLEFRILSALMITEGAEGIRSVALPFLVYGATGKLSYASLVAVAGAIPAVVVGIIGSPQVEKLNRKNIIIYSNIIRSILLITLPFTWGAVGIPAIMLISFISAALGSLEKPSMYSSLPVIFGERYQEFIGKRAGVSFLMQSIGPVSGGALVGFFGANWTLFICGFFYVLYAIIIATIKNFDSGYADRSALFKNKKNIHMIREGIDVARSVPALKTMYIFWFFSMSAVPIGVLSAVPYISNNLNLTSFEYGIASTFYGVATIVSSLVAGKMKFFGSPRRWLLLSGIVYGIVNLLMGFEPNFILFCILWFVWGIAYGPEEVVGNLVFVKSSPEEMQGRLFSLMTVVMTGGMLVGNSVVGPISDIFGPQWAMFLAGLIFLLSTIFSFAFGRGAKEISLIKIYDPPVSEQK